MLDNAEANLSPVLGDKYFSLIENTQRVALCMTVSILPTGLIENIRFFPAVINVRNNYTYENVTSDNVIYSELLSAAKCCNANSIASKQRPILLVVFVGSINACFK